MSKVIDISPQNSSFASSNLAFHMMYSTYKLNMQGDNIQHWYTSFPIWIQSVLCPVLTVALHVYAKYTRWQYIALMYVFRNLDSVCSMSSSNGCFLTCIQVSQVIDKLVWYSHFFKNFPLFVVIHTVKGFSEVNEAEVDVFLEFPCFLYDPMDLGNLISGTSAFSKSNLYIWKFLVHILLKPSLEDFEHYLASMWNEHNCPIVWTFFGIALLWDWNENGPFPVLWPLLSFLNLLAYRWFKW